MAHVPQNQGPLRVDPLDRHPIASSDDDSEKKRAYKVILGFDEFERIFVFLDLPDLISCRAAEWGDKPLWDSERLWRLLKLRFESMCKENVVFRPSFATQESKMEVLEAEMEMTGPAKWERLVDEVHSGHPMFVKKKITSIFRSNPNSDYKLYLIPGGRFLVVLGEAELSVWDIHGKIFQQVVETTTQLPLNTPPKDSPTPTKLASTFSNCNLFMCASQNTADGKACIRIIAITINDEDDFRRRRYQVFEIFLGEPHPALISIAEKSFTNPFEYELTSVCGDRLAMVNGKNIIIWDFVTHEWAMWDVSDDDFSVSRKVFLTRETIALLGQTKIVEWDIPTLTGDARIDNMDYGVTPTLTLQPRIAVDLMAEHQGSLYLVAGGLCHWYNGSDKPMWIDFIKNDPKTKPVEYDRIRFHHSRFPGEGVFESISQSSTLPGASLINLHGKANYRLCGQNFVTVWPELNALVCRSGSLNPEPDRPGKVFVLVEIESNTVDKRAVSLCPITGTLCYVDKPAGKLVVLQYFRPPGA